MQKKVQPKKKRPPQLQKEKGVRKKRRYLSSNLYYRGSTPVTVKLGREVEEVQFKNTYEKLKIIYELD